MTATFNTLPEVRGELEQNAPLGELVWFRTGGPADWLFRPADLDDLQDFLAALPDDMPVLPLGVGSNLLVRDGGVAGVVVRLSKAFAGIERVDPVTLRCGAAAMGITVASAARDAGIAGLEFLRGIPGTVGGAVRMNAGAYGRDLADILVECTVVMRDGDRRVLPASALAYSYRHADLPDDAIVVDAVLRGRSGDRVVIQAEMDRIAAEREASQPLRTRTGGSTFKNPQLQRAWELIDAAGCRGLMVGGAQVSEKHCNFLLNLGDATSADIERLGETVRARVKASTGIELQWEIQRVGRSADMAALPLHVVVLMGGWSSERAVSLKSGAGIAAALERLGHRVTPLDMGRDVAAQLAALKPDVVFNALHGAPGEDGSVQGLLELMGIPYTHSGVTASAVAIDKQMTKAVLTAAGIRMPAGRIVESESLFASDPLPRPYVLKPNAEGSSVGVAIITEGSNVGNPIRRDAAGPWRDFAELLAEPFIPGRELTVTVLDGQALAVTELAPKSGFYDYDAKYTDGLTEHRVPAPIHRQAYAEALAMAQAAHQALGCAGITRSDFRYDDTAGEPGDLYLLEVNTQPGMTPLSLAPEQAAHCGMSFDELVARILACARVEVPA